MLSILGLAFDLIFVVIFLVFLEMYLKKGVFNALFATVNFVLSIFITMFLYKHVSAVLETFFSFGWSISYTVAFFLTLIFVDLVLEFLLGFVRNKLAIVLVKYLPLRRDILIMFFAFINSVMFSSLLFNFVLSIPFPGQVKEDMGHSIVLSYVTKKFIGIEALTYDAFGHLVNDGLNYLLISPNYAGSVALNTDVGSNDIAASLLTEDPVAEKELFELANKERKIRKIDLLEWDDSLVPAARNHARDMWMRNYFGHISPDGESVGNRLDQAGIYYEYAGENLALAQNVQVAHASLMASRSHKEAILDKEFTKVGIGVIDSGYKGKLFVMVFKD